MRDYQPGWWGSFHSREHEYRKLRDAGWPASSAWRTAKIRERFYALEEQGRVQLLTEPDDMPYDWGDLEPSEADVQRLDDDGVWILFAKAIGPEGRFETVDSCGGFIGYDWQNSGYDTDIMLAACELAEALPCVPPVGPANEGKGKVACSRLRWFQGGMYA